MPAPPIRVFRVGLTGGIASGKSAAAARFAQHGVPVIDADAVARDLVLPGTPLLARIVEQFGPSALDRHGALDRGAMRRRVFEDPAARARLEAILHPAIRREMNERGLAAGGPYQIFAIPLLVERQAQETVDRVLVIDCPRDVQIARLVARDGSSVAEAEAILASQASQEARLAAADDVILNDGDLSALSDKVDRLHSKYLDLADRRLCDPTHSRRIV